MKKISFLFIFFCITVSTVAQKPTEFWGTTNIGGSGLGTFFKTDSNGTNLIVLDSLYDDKGKQPSGPLTLGTNGKIYAVTSEGGAYNNGTLLECDPAINKGIVTKKIDFNRALTGAIPKFPPVEAANGKLYGTTKEGGAENGGILYEYDPATGTLTKKFDFTWHDGLNPNGLVKASNNKLYGSTKNGGTYNCGVLFEFDPSTGIFTKKSEINKPGQLYGTGYPDGNLIQAINGKLYGLGVAVLSSTGKEVTMMLFEYDIPADTLTIKFINHSESYAPGFTCGSLVEVPGSKLYGIKNKYPGIFEYNLTTSAFNVTYSFKSGEVSQGTLMLASNGKLYGLGAGGAYGKGVLFEYDYLTNIYTSTFNFDGAHGAFYTNVANNALLEVCKSIPCEIPSDTVITACEDSTAIIRSGVPPNGYTFQWYKDEQPVQNATSENLTFPFVKMTDAGIYFCRVNNGCRSIQTKKITLNVKGLKDCLVGIHEKSANSLFKLYPNPGNDQVTIRMEDGNARSIAIELIDLLGRSVFVDYAVQTNSDNTISLNIADLTKGIYMLKVINLQTNKIGYQKLIKE